VWQDAQAASLPLANLILRLKKNLPSTADGPEYSGLAVLANAAYFFLV